MTARTIIKLSLITGTFWIPLLSIADIAPIIQTIEMTPVNAESYGLTEQTENKIPVDLWKGLTHVQVVALIKSLPDHQDNPVIARLQKKLILAATKTPPTKPGEEAENILKLRIWNLEKAWHIEEAYLLAKRHPEVLGEDAWGWLEFSYYVQMENYKQALTIAKEHLAKNPENPQWLKGMIGLQLLKEEKEQALLGLSLLEENPSPDNAAFLTAMRALVEAKSIQEGFEPSTMVELKLWLKGKEKKILELPGKFLPTAFASKAFKDLDVKDKILAAEGAFKKGLFSLKNLRDLYKEHGKAETLTIEPLTKEDLDLQAVLMPQSSIAWEKDDPLVRAQLYEKIDTTTDVAQKAHFISQLIQHLFKYQLHHLGQVIVEHLKQLSVEEAFMAHAPSFAQVLLHHHEQEFGTKWLSLLKIEDKKVLAPLILISLDGVSLEAKRNLFALWYEELPEDKKNLITLGVFEAIVPGITNHRMIELPGSVFPEFKNPALLWQLQFALLEQKGAALVYTLLLAKEVYATENSALLPYLIYALKSLGYGVEAKELTLGYLLNS
jgi:hypothetical protein